ncbi:MAG: oligopeptide/dipeptide ABC transporter ATP-binding protein [Pseudomonadota bacterium]
MTHRPLFGKPSELRAVDGVSLSIRQGETFAIVGESGCGKSTSARLLTRLIEPSSGEVLYDGSDISHLRAGTMRALRRDLQLVFQDPFSSLNPRMSVAALVEEPMQAHGLGDRDARRARAEDLLRRVGLRPDYADRYPHEFSGGQRQRIGIARALATGPKVVIADEPVSALDVSIQAQVINLLEELKDEFGLTLVIIAHDLAVIRHMADRVAVMYLGIVVEIASTEALFETPQHPYSQALISAIPAPFVGPRAARMHLVGDPPSPASPPSGCRFHTRCPHAQPRCATQTPNLVDLGSGRAVACHLHDEISHVGLVRAAPTRSPGAVRRFELYRALRTNEVAGGDVVNSVNLSR